MEERKLLLVMPMQAIWSAGARGRMLAGYADSRCHERLVALHLFVPNSPNDVLSARFSPKRWHTTCYSNHWHPGVAIGVNEFDYLVHMLLPMLSFVEPHMFSICAQRLCAVEEGIGSFWVLCGLCLHFTFEYMVR